MRSIAVGKDEQGILRLLLNGKPLFQIGPLDQGWWPDGLLTPPSDAAMKYDLEVLKSLGMNMLRKHI
jgi:beta-galactosidase/beta-glucuronidase